MLTQPMSSPMMMMMLGFGACAAAGAAAAIAARESATAAICNIRDGAVICSILQGVGSIGGGV